MHALKVRNTHSKSNEGRRGKRRCSPLLEKERRTNGGRQSKVWWRQGGVRVSFEGGENKEGNVTTESSLKIETKR